MLIVRLLSGWLEAGFEGAYSGSDCSDLNIRMQQGVEI